VTQGGGVIRRPRHDRRQRALYLRYAPRLVDGWLEPYSARLIIALSEIQTERGLSGGVGEIGVHHGRLMVLLLLLSQADEGAFVCDIFDRQHLNLDLSGLGDEAIFDANVRRFCGDGGWITKFRCSSFDLDPEELVRRVGRIRLLSIDGGHTPECALNDVSIAEKVLVDDGIVIVDDYFNADWPGVSEGIGRYLAVPEARLVPFAVAPNKLLLTTRGAAAAYVEGLAALGFAPLKTSAMFGHPVTLYREARRRSPLARAVRPYLWSAYSWLHRLEAALPRRG